MIADDVEHRRTGSNHHDKQGKGLPSKILAGPLSLELYRPDGSVWDAPGA
jgi:hypothetical protein